MSISIGHVAQPPNTDDFSLADHLPVLCWTASADGHIYWYNRRWFDYTGTTLDTQNGWGWQSVHDPKYLPRVIQQWEHSIATGEPFEMTFPLKGADGVFRPFLTRAVPCLDDHGQVHRWYGTNVDISAQVAAEEALRVSEGRFRSFTEAMPNHVWTSNAKGSLEWFNSTVYDYFGLTLAELQGDGWTNCVHPDDLESAARHWQSALASGNFYETEFRLKRSDGSFRWHIARATPIKDETGVVTQWIGTNTDIDEQKRVEQALVESERRLILSQNAAGIASLEVDISSGMVVGSDGLWDLWGLPTQKAIHISVLENIVLAEDRNTCSTPQTRALGTATPVVEYRIRRADTRELRWLWRAVEFVHDNTGAPVKMFGVIQDITERKSVELALRESEARYRGAMSVSRIGSWETDFVAGKRHWSPEALELFGFSLPDGVGVVGGENDEFASALHPDDRHLVAKFHELARTVDSFDAEYRIVRPDGELVWLSGRAQVSARETDGRCRKLINIVADVTEKKVASDHIRSILLEMTHRSKNLLAIIQGVARQTARRSATMADFHNNFSDRLQGLAASHDLLVEQNWRSVSLTALVRRQLASFVAADSQRLKVSGPALELNPRAAQAIGLALHELSTNAVKYGALSLPTGRVTVSWAAEKMSDGDANLVMHWVESGGPPVTPSSKSGFGSEVITRIAPRSISGTAEIEYDRKGIRYTLMAPLAILSAKNKEATIKYF